MTQRIGDQVGQGLIGEITAQALVDLGQRLVEAIALGRQHALADHLLEVFDLGGDGRVADDAVVDGVQAIVAHTRHAVFTKAHAQFAEVLDLGARLHHRGTPTHQHRLRQCHMRMAADDDIDAGHLLDQFHFLAAPAAIGLLGDAHVREQDDHLGALLAQLGHGFPGGGDRVGEGHRLDHRADGHGVVAKQAEQTETNAAALDQLVRQDAPGLDVRLQAVIGLARGIETHVARQ